VESIYISILNDPEKRRTNDWQRIPISAGLLHAVFQTHCPLLGSTLGDPFFTIARLNATDVYESSGKYKGNHCAK